jgi:hypothetical protein
MVITQTPGPFREFPFKPIRHAGAALELDPVPLPVIKADCFDAIESRQGPRQTSRRVLTAGKQDQRGISGEARGHGFDMGARRLPINNAPFPLL